MLRDINHARHDRPPLFPCVKFVAANQRQNHYRRESWHSCECWLLLVSFRFRASRLTDNKIFWTMIDVGAELSLRNDVSVHVNVYLLLELLLVKFGVSFCFLSISGWYYLRRWLHLYLLVCDVFYGLCHYLYFVYDFIINNNSGMTTDGNISHSKHLPLRRLGRHGGGDAFMRADARK